MTNIPSARFGTWKELIQMQLSKKIKIFSRFLSVFLKSASSFKHFQKEDDSHSLCIFEITAVKDIGRQMFK